MAAQKIRAAQNAAHTETLTSSINHLLDRLQGVRRTGPGRWIARCPAHDDRDPSLSIRELDDGRILLHCFAGCDVHAIVSAVGMKLSDLFPPRPLLDGRAPERNPFSAEDALRCLAFEARLVQLAALDQLAGRVPTQKDVERLSLAADRIDEALEVVWTR